MASHLRSSWTSEEGRLQWVDACFQAVANSQNLHFLSGQAWDYMQGLLKEAGMSVEDHEKYVRRLCLIRAVYQDRVERRPDKPWDDDSYRRCQYEVDYDQDCFQVVAPDGSVCSGTSSKM